MLSLLNAKCAFFAISDIDSTGHSFLCRLGAFDHACIFLACLSKGGTNW